MAYIIGVNDTDFFNELSHVLQKKYFNIKLKKFLPTIDNIYYSVFLEDDSNENARLKPFLAELESLKQFVIENHDSQEFRNGLNLSNKSYKLYKYCLSNEDLYDIFILSYLPNADTPRILVQIRSFGLWTTSAEQMLRTSYNHILGLFKPLGCKISKCRESRIDYCYHTNIITNPEKVLSDRLMLNHMVTTMEKWGGMGRVEKSDDKLGSILRRDYFSLGLRRSNNVYIRIYNKALEVIEMGYKQYFFEIWYQNGLINFYDKYCFQYALEHKNYDYVHKAKLKFYLEYDGSNLVKRIEFETALNDADKPLKEFKSLAKGFMPEVTTIMNIEFETKRRFYYFSDDFIDALKFEKRVGVPDAMNRLFRIIDNRAVFLDYLTSKTLSFIKEKKDDDGEKIVYLSWWDRLRNTKLEGFKLDTRLVREYSSMIDKRLAKRRFINAVATNAVYNDKIYSDFIEDISDVLSNLNDNHVINFTIVSDYGEIIDSIESELLDTYKGKKESKEKRLRNRKSSIKEEEPVSEVQ